MEKVGVKARIIGEMKNLNTKTDFLDFLKRPWEVFNKGSTRAAIFTVASGVTLGALAYIGAQSMMRVKSNDSHASRVEESRTQYDGAGPRLA
jgi:hypothetical protein